MRQGADENAYGGEADDPQSGLARTDKPGKHRPCCGGCGNDDRSGLELSEHRGVEHVGTGGGINGLTAFWNEPKL